MDSQAAVSLVTHQKKDNYKMVIAIVFQDMAILMNILNNVKVILNCITKVCSQ